MNREEFEELICDKLGMWLSPSIESLAKELERLFKSSLSLPPAEGAEAFVNKYYNLPESKIKLVRIGSLIKCVERFATFHAQRIADKMVSERLSSIGDAGKVAIGLSKHLNEQEQAYFLAGFQACIDYLKIYQP